MYGEIVVMKIVVCLDVNNGMSFNHRRQSRDAELIREIVKLAEKDTIYINKCSEDLFPEEIFDDVIIYVLDNEIFDIDINQDGLLFVEEPIDVKLLKEANEIILCYWDKEYPADVFWDYDLNSFTCVKQYSIKGKSHDKIMIQRWEKRNAIGS